MYEIWTYGVSAGADKVYYAVWGGGVLEYDVKTEPMEGLQRSRRRNRNRAAQGPGADSRDHHLGKLGRERPILWVATYFGASRYDGRYWRNFLDKDSGLPSNFLNQVKTVDGTRAWFSTDKGLAYYDGANWAVYRPALDTKAPEMLVRDAQGKITRIAGDYGSLPPLHPRAWIFRATISGWPRPRASATESALKQEETTK